MIVSQIPSQSDAFHGLASETEHPTLLSAWRHTTTRLEQIRQSLAKRFADTDTISGIPVSGISVFLAGSYGRLEAFSDVSDADVIVVLPDSRPVPESEVRMAVLHEVTAAMRDAGLPDCNPAGVFTTCYTLEELTEQSGNRDEDTPLLSQRMLLIMEARMVFNEEVGQRVMNGLLAHYTEYQRADPQKELVYLLNDAIRYFRTVCVSYQYTFRTDAAKWALRNTKLRHSRVIMYMGTLLLLLNASSKENGEDKTAYVDSELGFPPLSRTVRVLVQVGETHAAECVLACYEHFLRGISTHDERAALACVYEQCHENNAYQALKRNASTLAASLSSAVYGRRGEQWTDRVFEYLLL